MGRNREFFTSLSTYGGAGWDAINLIRTGASYNPNGLLVGGALAIMDPVYQQWLNNYVFNSGAYIGASDHQ